MNHFDPRLKIAADAVVDAILLTRDDPGHPSAINAINACNDLIEELGGVRLEGKTPGHAALYLIALYIARKG